MRGVRGFLVCLLVLVPAAAVAADEAILAGGCFWCVESDFDTLEGVVETTSGYIGGRFPNPTYQSHVSNGDLEAVRVRFDPAVVDYRTVLDVFWRTIDVTDDRGQFCDRGNSYRTAVFVRSAEERAIAEASKAAAEEALGRPIVTRILDAPTFWPAEDYHQDYYLKNPLRYRYYRFACGRDQRVRQVWGEAAFWGLAKD
jgi:peptide-methionine (S)-S-oxide reductase